LEPIFVVGFPGPIGGACTELWHVLKLWRRFGLEVHLIPSWSSPPKLWRQRVKAIGCTIHRANPNQDDLGAIDGLRDGLVVSFCNAAFLGEADQFHQLGCRVVWVNCMNWLHEHERRLYAVQGPFDAYVCQSQFQRRRLASELSGFGVRSAQFHHVPGFIDVDEFEFAPQERTAGDPFVMGRLSRASPAKFSTNTWPILRRVDYENKRYRVMGYNDAVTKTIGQPPAFVETLAECAEDTPAFLASLHAYCQINGVENENWPRTGLEAMASGVPIVVERRGGWPEMIDHGRTGFTCESDGEMAHWLAHLAYDETFRLEMAHRAYHRLIHTLSDPEDLWARWCRVFRSIPKKGEPSGRNGKTRHRRGGRRNGRRPGRSVRRMPAKVGA
jgi:glycosyltransferase involved in cell wall biosynthesis